MNDQKQLDIISSVLDHPQWEAPYLMELVRYAMSIEPKVIELPEESTPSPEQQSNPKIELFTNTAFLLNTYFTNTTPDTAVDGKVYSFIRAIHNAQNNVMIKVTFESVPRV